MKKKWILGIGILAVIAAWLVFLTVGYINLKVAHNDLEMEIQVLKQLAGIGSDDNRIYEKYDAWFNEEKIFYLPGEE